MKRSVAALILIAWGALGFFVACSETPEPQGKAPAQRIEAAAPKPEPAAPPKPEAIAPKPEAIAPKPEMAPSKPEVKAEAPGEIAALILASEETILSSQMAGRIRRVNVGLGDEVKSGAPLIEFDCGEQRAQLDAADADYRGARETHIARMKLQALGAAGELEVTVAAAAADKARSQVTLRRSQLAYCSVASPFRGRVARLRVKSSESVQSGQPLVDVVNPSVLKAQVFVPAAWIVWLRPGAAITIGANGQAYPARISKLNSRVDGVSQQLEVEALIEDGKGLVPGMIGVATFNLPK
jgi:RND family efflux transporter MFP subunit